MKTIVLTTLVTATLITLGSFASGQTSSTAPSLIIDAGKVAAPVSATLYGLMTEEINYSYEGGIYGELIQNRIFRDDTRHWSVVQNGGGTGAISLDETQPIKDTVLTKSLKLDASQATAGHRVEIAKPGEPPPPPPAPKQVPALFYVATKDSKSGAIYLKVVNSASTAQDVQIKLDGAGSIAPEGTLITLSSAHPTDTNSITEPTKIAPVTTKATGLGSTFAQTFAPYSINVLQIEPH